MGRKNHILIVDREVGVCLSIEAKLAETGVTVTTVHSAVQAIEQIRTACYDAVILGCTLSCADDLAMLAEIRRCGAQLLVILMDAPQGCEMLKHVGNSWTIVRIVKPRN
ncbi:MAG: hypothetical protein QHI38_00720, partial [Armatimonadota bacterium]|nr:hypothetical protein [Armatimonadota bacterium]